MKNKIVREDKQLLEACKLCKLKTFPFSHLLSDVEKMEIQKHKKCSSYIKGDNLFKIGEKPIGLFFLQKGKLKLVSEGVNGKEQIIRLAKSGDVVGYRSLLLNDCYRLSAITLEDCSICLIDKEYFELSLKNKPKLLFDIIQRINNDLINAEKHLLSLSQKNVRERMAESLLFFKITYGLQKDNMTLNINFSREEIANYTGTSTESAIRLLSEFNQDGIIKIDKKKIMILDINRLIKTANLND